MARTGGPQHVQMVRNNSSDPLLGHALKLLARRDYSVFQIRTRLEKRSGAGPEALDEVIRQLSKARYLDDERFARNFVRTRLDRGRPRLERDLKDAGVADGLAERVLDAQDWPSLGQALRAKMKDLKVEPPLRVSDAGRLSRALERLGYDAEDVAAELERLL